MKNNDTGYDKQRCMLFLLQIPDISFYGLSRSIAHDKCWCSVTAFCKSKSKIVYLLSTYSTGNITHHSNCFSLSSLVYFCLHNDPSIANLWLLVPTTFLKGELVLECEPCLRIAVFLGPELKHHNVNTTAYM